LAGVLGSVLFAGGAAPASGPETPAAAHVKNLADAALDRSFADHVQSRSWTLKSVNVDNRTITIWDRPRGGGGFQLVLGDGNPANRPPDQKGARLEGLQLAPQAKVFIDGRAASLEELKLGMALLVKIAHGKTQIAEILAVTNGREDQYFVEAVDLKRNTVTVRVNNTTAELPLAKSAKLIVETIPPGTRESQTIEGPMTDLPRGIPVHLQMGVQDDRLVIRVLKISQ
jgi:hypothetical protein